MKIDARGLACPEPVVKTKQALGMIEEGTVEVLVDNEGAVGNLKRLAQSQRHACTASKEGKNWRVRITKAGTDAAVSPPACAPPEGDTFLIVGTDSLGPDEKLGNVLMIRLFETMAAGADLPRTVFFLNSGVRLTTTEDSVVPQVRRLAERGVEVFSCGTCLKFYGLEARLAVGTTGSIDQVVDAVTGGCRVVWV